MSDRNAILEEAAMAAEAEVDKDWPNDDISRQCVRIASLIRDLKKRPDVSVSIGVTTPGDKHFGSGGGVSASVLGGHGGGNASGGVSTVFGGGASSAPHEDRLVRAADGHINFVVLASCADDTSHKNNGEAFTWAETIRAIENQLMKWIDEDGYNVRIIAVSATRDPVEHRRTGPV